MGMKPRGHRFKDWEPGTFRIRMQIVTPAGGTAEYTMPRLGKASGDALVILAARISGCQPTAVVYTDPDGKEVRLETGGERDRKRVLLTLNGRERMFAEGSYTHEQLAEYAGNILDPTITVRGKTGSGTLLPGESISVEQGMVINVAYTGGA